MADSRATNNMGQEHLDYEAAERNGRRRRRTRRAWLAFCIISIGAVTVDILLPSWSNHLADVRRTVSTLTLFQACNIVEAVLWWAVAMVCLVISRRRAAVTGRHYLVCSAVLLAFGVSDLVECQTGAWWRPWWLFAWKAACVAAILAILLAARRSTLRRREKSEIKAT